MGRFKISVFGIPSLSTSLSIFWVLVCVIITLSCEAWRELHAWLQSYQELPASLAILSDILTFFDVKKIQILRQEHQKWGKYIKFRFWFDGNRIKIAFKSHKHFCHFCKTDFFFQNFCNINKKSWRGKNQHCNDAKIHIG